MNSHVSGSHWRKWVQLCDLLYELVLRDLKLRYKRSVLGIAWSLLVPLAQLAVLYVVFHRLLPLNIPSYPTFLLTGILPWTWFQSSLLSASGAIVDNRDLVRQAGFPVVVLPSISVITQLIHFLLALPILAVFLLLDGYRMNIAILALPAIIVIQFALTLSLAYVTATFQVTFRDTQYLLGIVLFLLFYLTPVFYDAAQLPARYQPIYRLNPIVHILGAYRSILITGRLPAGQSMLLLCALSVAILTVGYSVFLKARDRFVEEL